MDKKYQKAGYIRPQIIFWNLNGLDFSTENIAGLSIVSGFNPDLLNLFLDGKKMTQDELVQSILYNNRYLHIRDACRSEKNLFPSQ